MPLKRYSECLSWCVRALTGARVLVKWYLDISYYSVWANYILYPSIRGPSCENFGM